MAFDFQAARKAGYTDAEIVQFLAQDKSAGFDVDGALKAGYAPEEIITHLEPKPQSTGYVDALKQGVSSVVGGVGETLEQFGAKGAASDTLKRMGDTVRPENYQPAQVVSPDGVDLSQAPRFIAEGAPGTAAAIAAAKITPGGAIPKGIGAALAYMLMTRGDEAKRSAEARTGVQGEQPTVGDKARSVVYGVPEAALNTIGALRFLPGAGKVTSVGAKGVVDSAKQLGARAGIEGLTEGAQDLVAQTGRQVGTDKGVTVDPYSVANNAIAGGMTGGALGAPRALKDANSAVKFREFGGPNADASAAIANRIQQAAEGDLKNTKTGYKAVSDVSYDIRTELRDASKGIEGLSPEAVNALKRAQSGKGPSDADVRALEDANAPENITALVRQAQVLSRLKELGDYGKGSFKGGLAGKLESHVRALQNPIGAGAAAGLSALGLSGNLAAMFTAAPAALGVIGGTYAGARTIDKFTGARSPAKQFVDRFQNPDVEVRAAAPVSPRTPTRPSVPLIPRIPQPWGSEAPTEPKYNPRSNVMVEEGMAKIAKDLANAKRKTFVSQATPLLERLAALQGPDAPIELPANFAKTLSNPGPAAEDIPSFLPPRQPPAPVPEAPKMTGALPTDVLKNGKAIVAALQRVAKLKQRVEGGNQADMLAADSPLLASIGGMNAVANPEAGKRVGQMVSAANAIRRLHADPDAEKETKPNRYVDPADDTVQVKKVSKSEGKIEQETDSGEYTPPRSTYANLSIEEAAARITKDAVAAGKVRFKSGYEKGVVARLTAIRGAAAQVAKEAPSIDAKELAAQFEGLTKAGNPFDLLARWKQAHPEAAASLDQYFNDEMIAKVWSQKRKPKDQS